MENNDMASPHTPGPWTFRKAIHHFHIEADAAGFGKAVAEVKFIQHVDTGWTSEANARLIAAAPDLLAFVERRHCSCLPGDHSHPDNPLCERCDLIAKATGAAAQGGK